MAAPDRTDRSPPTSARCLSRLGIGRAEQRFVGGAEVGCGQATWVQLPDLFGYRDRDLDVLAAAGGVEALGIRAELRLGVQRFVADREQGGGGDPVAESVRGHGRGLHVHGEGARLTEAIFGLGQVQLPVPVRGGVNDSHPAAQAPGCQLAEQQRVQRVVRYDRNAQRQHVVKDTVIAHVGGRQHQVPDFLVVAQASTVPDHQHQVRAQHREVIGDRLGVRRPDSYVHHGHARTPGKHVVPRGHLAAIRIRAAATRQGGAKLLHVPGVVCQQHVPLERFGGCPGVVLEPVDRQGHALRREQEQFLAPQIPAGFVNRRRKTWITQI